MPLTTHYIYKRKENGKISKRKAQTNTWDERMFPNVHFWEDRISVYMVGKASIRLLYAFASQLRLKRLVLGIKCAFPHEKEQYLKPIDFM